MEHGVSRKNWANLPWIWLTRQDLKIEYQQSREEGRDLSSVADAFEELDGCDLSVELNQRCAGELLELVQGLPLVAGYPYREPSDLSGILRERPEGPDLPRGLPADDVLLDKALGGWLGRCCGCLLGKPVEGWRSWQIDGLLKAQGRWPLDRYFSRVAPAEAVNQLGVNLDGQGMYEEDIVGMVEDDDTNYTVTGLALVARHGEAFVPEDVANFWLSHIPFTHVCTAERVAYRNLLNCIPPPESASYRNPYREWIGAQIRADFFGYVNPGNPERAAEFAWRDACVSHVKNGIYGEMWVAAMLATAYVCEDIHTVIRAGLAQIPAQCRLREAVERMLALHASGAGYEEAVAGLRSRWDETNGHHWCHTISNAEIVAMALLWGEGDFERTICSGVTPGFDTDCNGATAGSVLGVMLGARQLPAKWTGPLHDALDTGVAGYHRVSLTCMAKETVRLMRELS